MFSDNNRLSLNPVHFFQLQADCKKRPGKKFPSLNPGNFKNYLLPDHSLLCLEESFVQVAIAQNQDGLELFMLFNKPFEQAFYPKYQEGDAVELFIDTRDVKNSGYQTRFCHQFYFLPVSVEGQQCDEISKFRTSEDSHVLCDPSRLKVHSNFQKNAYSMQLFIPSDCLFEFDPDQFDRLGFTYCIHRFGNNPLHFSCKSSEYSIEKQPSLWASLRLCDS